MRTILNDRHTLHQGRFEMFRGELVPCFEKPDRADHVLAELQRRALGPVEAPDAFDEALLAQVGDLPPMRRVWLGRDAAPASATPWRDWLGQAAAFQPPAIEPSWGFNLIYSSGTTGTPKGILQPHGMRFMHVQRGVLNGYGPQAVTLLSTPLYSNTTLVSFFPTMGLGGAALIMPKFEAGAFLRLAQLHLARAANFPQDDMTGVAVELFVGESHTPVEPKPPVPRTVSSRSVTSSKRACWTGAGTSWAMRSPRAIANGALPRLARITFTSPR